MNRELFHNTKTLAGLIWRRDRIQIPIWIISIVAFSIAIALAFPALYPPGPERQVVVQTMQNPALISMVGPIFGVDNYHMGAIMAHQMLLFTAVVVAIMNITLTIRHTRRDEESGRIEVIRSLPVGRLSNAASVLLVLSLTNLALGLIMALGLGVLGLEGMDWAGSFLYGAVLAVTGIFFAAATLFFAQLTETSRAAMGFSYGFLGAAYLLRAVGDIGTEALSYISPLGLVLRAQVYVRNFWWPVLIVLAAAGVIAVLALRLNTVRDLEAGFVAAKPGRRNASRLLQSPFGLALRLEKTTIIGWAVAMLVLGMSYGSVFADVEDFAQTTELYQQILPSVAGFSANDLFLAMLLSVMSMVGAIPSLLVMLKLRAEERANRTEHLLARAVSRPQLLASFLVISLVIAVVMQLLGILGVWLGASSVLENPFPLSETIWAGLAYVPPMWIMVGLGAFLTAFAPKWTRLVWLYLGYILFTDYFGGLLQLPEWMGKLTPWGHIPEVPLETIGFGTVLGSLLVAVVLIGLGFYGYRHRDIYG